MPDVLIRAATESDLGAIAAVTLATGQEDGEGGADPGYVRHLMTHGRVVVAEAAAKVAGFGAVQRIGAAGPEAVTMLCDLFVHPAAHGQGVGRALLADLWAGARRRMTFSSLHAHAVPLYTSFGLDAWWPLLYLHGDPPPGPGARSVRAVTADEAAAREQAWTGADRAADYRFWAGRPGGQAVLAMTGHAVSAAGVVAGTSLRHLAIDPAADDSAAGDAVLQVLAWLPGPGRVCLPAPHPAVRPLLALGWRLEEFDLFMASGPGLLDPRRAVPSPGLA